jgi:hypothetical protein
MDEGPGAGSVASGVLRVRRGDVVEGLALGEGAVACFEGVTPWRAFGWRRGQAHYPGLYWSVVMGGHVGYESRLELAWLLLADRDRRIRRIYSQPFQLEARVDGRLCRHVPDYLAVRDDGLVTVVDVKPRRRLADPGVAFTFGWTRFLAGAQGWGFEVFSEPPTAVLANAGFLAGYRRGWQFAPGLLDAIAGLASPAASFAELDQAAAGLAGDRATGRAHLLHLIWAGRLRADLERPLSESMVLVAA